MNHGFKLHTDGTLEIIVPNGVKVGRVFVLEAGTQNGSLYYPEGDAPDINVGDIISRQEIFRAFEEMCSCTDYVWDERDFRDLIKKIPSAQPERKKGKWVEYDGDWLKTMCKCSKCGAMIDINEKYRNFFCYHCGADMR